MQMLLQIDIFRHKQGEKLDILKFVWVRDEVVIQYLIWKTRQK